MWHPAVFLVLPLAAFGFSRASVLYPRPAAIPLKGRGSATLIAKVDIQLEKLPQLGPAPPPAGEPLAGCLGAAAPCRLAQQAACGRCLPAGGRPSAQQPLRFKQCAVLCNGPRLRQEICWWRCRVTKQLAAVRVVRPAQTSAPIGLYDCYLLLSRLKLSLLSSLP